MLDLRIYRAAFLPAVLAMVVAAFALQSRERPIPAAPLAPDAFDGRRAIAELEALGRSYPDRRPGSAGDARLAGRVAASLRVGGEFDVSTHRFDAQTADGERGLINVVGVRQGLDPRRIVVIGHRDALQAGSTAQLSSTAALLELARVFRVGRSLRHTLVLVSTSGASAGLAGAREFAKDPGGPVQAVIVLGDMGGAQTRRPLVVGFSNGLGAAPAPLMDGVRAALRAEVGLRPGGYRLASRVARLAFPLTLSEQGEANERGLPSVLLSATGERGPGAEADVSRKRLQSFGRAALRTVGAVDDARQVDRPTADLGVQTKVLPGWAVRMVTGLLILPALLAAVDGFARMRRRRQAVGMWLRWALTGALPFLMAAAAAWALRFVGVLAAPGAPAPADALPLDRGALAAMGGVGLVWIAGWLAVRPLALRALRVSGAPEQGGAGAAVALLLVAVVGVVWLSNPYTAAFLLTALHVWTLCVDPQPRIPRLAAAAASVLALAVPLALVALVYMQQFAMSAGELAWMLFLLVAGGGVGLGGVLAWSLLGGCLLSVLAILRRRPTPEATEPWVTRGPQRHAGRRGSLGGTESALRR